MTHTLYACTYVHTYSTYVHTVQYICTYSAVHMNIQCSTYEHTVQYICTYSVACTPPSAARAQNTHVSEDGDEVPVEVNSFIESKQNGLIDSGRGGGGAEEEQEEGQGRGRRGTGREQRQGCFTIPLVIREKRSGACLTHIV